MTASLRNPLLLVPFLLLGVAPVPEAGADQEAQPSNTGVVLLARVKAQIKALNAEDPDAVMKVFHPQAPGLRGIRRTLVGQFARYDDAFSLKEHKYVGLDGRYAYMRTVQLIKGVRNGKQFVTALEDLLVFKRHGKAWLAWTSARLDQATRTKKSHPRKR